jgi:hypothetical protein
MANPIAYNSGTTVSGCINTGTISLAVDNLNYSTRPGNLNWFAGGDNTNKYIIISDTYSQGVDTQANSRPTMWATSALTDNELLKWINGLPARSGQSTFATLTDAISWLTSQNKYLISNQHYPQIVTSGMVLNLDAGFTASYPNVGTSWYDLYSGGTGSLNNGPTWNNLGMSSNISFDGTNDYYELTNRNTSLEFQPNQPYSCLVFYRTPSSALNGGLIANMKNAGSPAFPGWDLWFNNGGIPNTIGAHLIANWSTDAIKVAVDYDYSLFSNRWVCFGYTYDGSVPTTSASTINSFDFYLNGKLHTNGKQLGDPQNLYPQSGDGFISPLTTITYDPNQRFRVASRWSSGSWVSGSQTSVAKVLVYNRKLTANEFAQNFYQGPIVTSGLTFAVDAGNLVSYGGVGTTVYDLVTTGRTATLTNGPTWTYLSGGTFSFDGTDDYGQATNLPILGNTAFTVSCFANVQSNPTAGSGDGGIVLYGKMGVANQVAGLYYRASDNYVRFTAWGGGGIDFATGFLKDFNVWHHWVLVYNETNVLVYRDGIADPNGAQARSLNMTEGTLTFGGAIANGSFLQQKIPMVQLYNRALSGNEIKQNFEAYRGRFGV